METHREGRRHGARARREGRLKVSPFGIRFLHGRESCVLHVYLDEGEKPTIGWGRLLSKKDIATGRFANGITQEEADELFREDIVWVEAAIAEHVKVPLSQNEYDALVSLVFNNGPDPLVQTLGHVLNDGQYDAVPGEMLRWCKVKKNGVLAVSKELVSRRHAEAALWSTSDQLTAWRAGLFMGPPA